jgi:tetratricopeptide (TPR) repeat protein
MPSVVVAQSEPTDEAIARATWLLGRNPRDARAHYRLGDAYIRKSRETGDVSYLGRAEDALRRAQALAPELAGASRHLAYALYLRHDFAGAAAQADRAIALDPGDAHAHAVLGDARLEVGDYEGAEDAYRRMLALRTDLAALSRRSALKRLRGDVTGAIADLELAIASGRASPHPAESVAWVQWQLGAERFAIGEVAAAEASFRASLETYPGYHRALAGLAQVRVAQSRHAEAAELYRKALRVVPLPDYAAALGEVYTKLGRPDEARKQHDLVEYMGRLNALNAVLYNRELATFYADHDVKVTEALALAEREREIRRDIYAADLYAWALYRNGRAKEAVAPMREALRLGTRDARLFFHAGLIHRDAGEPVAAKTYLRLALATNPHFHPRFADVAREALAALESSAAARP